MRAGLRLQVAPSIWLGKLLTGQAGLAPTSEMGPVTGVEFLSEARGVESKFSGDDDLPKSSAGKAVCRLARASDESLGDKRPFGQASRDGCQTGASTQVFLSG